MTMIQKGLANVFLAFSLSVFASTQVYATELIHSPQDNVELSCDVLKDAFLWSLFKPIGEVLAQYNDERQFMVDKLVEVKRLEQGQYYWEATLKVTTFEGAHNPPYHYYTITFNNLNTDQPQAIYVKREE